MGADIEHASYRPVNWANYDLNELATIAALYENDEDWIESLINIRFKAGQVHFCLVNIREKWAKLTTNSDINGSDITPEPKMQFFQKFDDVILL